jgi:hypothetical protein
MFRDVRYAAFVLGLSCALSLGQSVSAEAQGGRREPSSETKPAEADEKTDPRKTDQKAQPRPADQKAVPRPPDQKKEPEGVARPPSPGRPTHPAGLPGRRGQFVFIGGYFYDPYFGPYPWWHRPTYPYPYYPVYDARARVRLIVKPSIAAVYVDGFYAGVVDDFDNLFQRLPLPPGGHEIALFLEGYRTVSRRLYLAPGSTLTLREIMEPLPVGTRSELPFLAVPVPRPPTGTFAPPVTPPYGQPRPPSAQGARPHAGGYGSFALRVLPADSEVMIDGERWLTSDEGQFIIQVSAGSHRLEIAKPGYLPFSTEVQIREGEETPLNVNLSPERR